MSTRLAEIRRQAEAEGADRDDVGESDDSGLSCDLCGRKLEDMSAASDHLEDAHCIVTNAILEHTAGIGGGT